MLPSKAIIKIVTYAVSGIELVEEEYGYPRPLLGGSSLPEGSLPLDEARL